MKIINKLPSALATFAAFGVLFGSTSSHAIDGEKVCSRVKTCVLESMEGQDVPQNMKDMLIGQLDSQCIDGYKAEEQKLIDAGLEDEANACAADMLKLSCPELMDPNQAKQLKSCQDFEEKRLAAGLEE